MSGLLRKIPQQLLYIPAVLHYIEKLRRKLPQRYCYIARRQHYIEPCLWKCPQDTSI